MLASIAASITYEKSSLVNCIPVGMLIGQIPIDSTSGYFYKNAIKILAHRDSIIPLMYGIRPLWISKMDSSGIVLSLYSGNTPILL